MATRKRNTRNKRSKAPRASNTSVKVYYPYRGNVYRATYNPNTKTIKVDGQEMTPTRAAKTVTDGVCGSVNGWTVWRFAQDSTIAGQTFNAGQPIGPARNALDQPIATRTATATAPPADDKPRKGKGNAKAKGSARKPRKPRKPRS